MQFQNITPVADFFENELHQQLLISILVFKHFEILIHLTLRTAFHTKFGP